jgi:signal transduction histidine kinase
MDLGRQLERAQDDGAAPGAEAAGPAAPRTDAADGAAPRDAAGAHWRYSLLFFFAYILAGSVSEFFPHPRFGVQPWNLHPALAIAIVAAGGRRAPVLVLVAIWTAWAIGSQGRPEALWIPAGLAMAAAYWGAGTVLRRWTLWGGREVGLRDVGLLLAVALGAALLCAVIEAARQFAASDLAPASFPLLAWRLFVADLLGIVVWTPLLLQWSGEAWSPGRILERPMGALRDAGFFLAALGALLLIVFGIQPLDQFRMSYLLFLPMIALAMRHGLAGIVAGVPAAEIGLLGALATLGTRPGTAFEFQFLVLVLAITALLLGTLSDERRRAAQRIARHERELRERSRALDEALRTASTAELAAALAHDLNQPLSAIGTYARAGQLLADRGPGEHAKLVETLEEINAESARAGQYLRRMREFFRTGSMRTDCVTVASLFESTHAHLRDRLVLAQVTWRTSIEPGLPKVRVDAIQTGAVLGNLVANACDALAEGVAWREVHLRALAVREKGRGTVRILVEDTGPGVPEALRAQLFKPMATSKPAGMGLGLALSRSIAERQGGRLWFEAGREFTTFCLELPAHDDAAAE